MVAKAKVARAVNALSIIGIVGIAALGAWLILEKSLATDSTTPQGSRPLQPVSCTDGKLPQIDTTGTRIAPDEDTEGESTVEIDNGNDLDAVVRVISGADSKTVRFVYIERKHKYTITGIEPGTYSIRYLLGQGWIGGCRQFQKDSVYGKFDDPFTIPVGHRRQYFLTLYAVPLGNAKTTTITRSEFLEGNQHSIQ